MNKLCIICGKEFESQNNRNKYCSAFCCHEQKKVRDRNELKKKREIERANNPKNGCIICGSKITKPAKYLCCSSECGRVNRINKTKVWRSRNKKRCSDYSRNYQIAHKSEILKNRRMRNAKNPEINREQIRKYREKNPIRIFERIYTNKTAQSIQRKLKYRNKHISKQTILFFQNLNLASQLKKIK